MKTLALRPVITDSQNLGLTIVVPVFNEEKTVCEILCDLISLDSSFRYEIIVINDGSTYSSSRIIKDLGHLLHVRYVELTKNQGKGNAVRTGIDLASYSHVLIFDADLEYSAFDIPRLMVPIMAGKADFVYGVRVRGINNLQPSHLYAVGRRFITTIANVIYGSAISDLYTCLKLLPTEFLRSIDLVENGFGLDAEISCQMLRNGFRPFEIPVTYVGRTHAEGKNIKFSDAIVCLKVIVKKRFVAKKRFEEFGYKKAFKSLTYAQKDSLMWHGERQWQ
jgi:glycosyltransferase involved in cell wall biosynthesis